MLRLDKLDDISKEWINSDVLILILVSGGFLGSFLAQMPVRPNIMTYPGQILTVNGLTMGCYFQVGESLKLGMSIATAFRTALQTWASWVDSTIDPEKTRIFFRTFEPSHWRNLTLRQCNVTKLPLSEIEGKDYSPFSDTVFEVVNNMIVPVTVVHITPMSASRSDAHVVPGATGHLYPTVATGVYLEYPISGTK
ncbi:protein trichome berefringence-like 7 [Sesamum angolense]|uniref:Protein trichome berefringence-like 7 n=1 Tax=Sesamum angolense TaxID=2727404 RepID=A0AAE1WI16_9LAMI|nr:protein trichome berefringence-like 7 [Sesamum angolense]